MNILIVCHFGLYSDFSSSFVHPQVLEYVRMGHNVKVLVPIAYGKPDWNRDRIAANKRIQDGVDLLPFRYVTMSKYGKRGFNFHSAICMLRIQIHKLLGKFKPDVIHAHTLGFDSKIGVWLKHRYNCPLVVTTHGSDTMHPFLKGRKKSLRSFCDGADCVVAVSTMLANKLRSTGTSTKIQVILNGFRTHCPMDWIKKRPYSFIQVGNLLKQKSFDITIRAFAKIKGNHSDAELTIIGQGPERKNLEDLCQSLNLKDSVCFLGQVPNYRVLEEMRKHQYFVMPSVREGFGIVYLEAMGNHCITIGTQGEGISDLIRDQYNGFLVPPRNYDAICQVVDWCEKHPCEVQTIVEQGALDVRELTWEKNARKYQAIFESSGK